MIHEIEEQGQKGEGVYFRRVNLLGVLRCLLLQVVLVMELLIIDGGTNTPCLPEKVLISCNKTLYIYTTKEGV